MIKALLILVVTVALIFTALNYHFILMDKNVKILKKVKVKAPTGCKPVASNLVV